MKNLVLIGIIAFSAQSFASGKYYVECKSESINLTFAAFGERNQTELEVVLDFQNRPVNSEGFDLKQNSTEPGGYVAHVQNLKFSLSSYPFFYKRNSSVGFSVSTRMFGDEYYRLEDGSCQSL